MSAAVDRDEGMMMYGMLGILSAVAMFGEILMCIMESVVSVLCVLSVFSALLILAVLLINGFIYHSVAAAICTSIIVAPFLFGCIYCGRLFNMRHRDQSK